MELVNKKYLIDYLIEKGYIKKQHGIKRVEPMAPSHGNCCCCTACGQFYSDCACVHNEWVNFVNSLITYTHEDKN